MHSGKGVAPRALSWRLRPALTRYLFLAAAATLLGTILSGCHTTNNPEVAEAAADATASVQIRGNTPGQIAEVATEVFEKHGYIRAGKRSYPLVFEKRGSKLSNLAYGSWTSDTPIWVRVKVSVLPAGEQTYLLQAIAYYVRDRGSSTEEELKVNRVSSWPYQKVLDEIAKRFRAPKTTAQPRQ